MTDKILVSLQDQWLITKYGWYLNDQGYVVSTCKIDGKQRRLHVEILGRPKKKIDHINGDKLDNRRENLRLCSHSQNMSNSKTPKTNTTGFKGVSRRNRKSAYEANIKVNSQQVYLGVFSEPEEAYLVYCIAAIFYKGEFANGG